MAAEDGPIVVPETVTPDATQEKTDEAMELTTVNQETPTEPILLSEEELAERAARAASPEGRLEASEAVKVGCWGCHVMVAPARGLKMYQKVFEKENFGRDLTDDESPIDVALLKELIVNCVVKPKITDETVDLLMEASAKDFMELSAACMVITQKDAETDFADILGVANTERQERFTGGQDGSTSTPTPA